jgi:hypothetical protein
MSNARVARGLATIVHAAACVAIEITILARSERFGAAHG